MKDSDYWSHTYRMYLIGSGSYRYPWHMPSDFPKNSLDMEAHQALTSFIQHDQAVFNPSLIDRTQHTFFKLFLPYLSAYSSGSIRRRIFRRAQHHLNKAMPESFWTDQFNRQFRLSFSKETVLCVDFIDQRLKRADFKGPKLPLTILISGQGTMENPF